MRKYKIALKQEMKMTKSKEEDSILKNGKQAQTTLDSREYEKLLHQAQGARLNVFTTYLPSWQNELVGCNSTDREGQSHANKQNITEIQVMMKIEKGVA